MRKIFIVFALLILSAYSFAQKKKETTVTPTIKNPLASKTEGIQR
jgi:hypothetical protein